MGELPKPMQIAAFADMLNPVLDDFISDATVLGEPLIEYANLVRRAFTELQNVMEYGLYNQKPTDDAAFFQQQPLSQVIQKIISFREKQQHAQFANHIQAIAEGILALSWITVAPAPIQFIKDIQSSSQYYGNRVLSSFKGVASHVSFIQKWNQILLTLQQYVKQYFTTGFTWGAVRTSSGGPPPPPPPPPAALLEPEITGAGDAGRQALINDLNKGLNITDRLRHVDRKNLPSGAPNAQVTSHTPVVSKTGGIKQAQAPKHARKHVLEGRKWVVAYHSGDTGIKVNIDDMSQSLLLHNCDNCFVELTAKCNNIIIDSCKKTSILVRDVISSIEVIRSDSLKIQLEGVVPLVNISGSDSVSVYVKEASRNSEIITSKCSALNLCIVKPDGDYVEMPIPEQIKTVISPKQDKLISSVVENI